MTVGSVSERSTLPWKLAAKRITGRGGEWFKVARDEIRVIYEFISYLKPPEMLGSTAEWQVASSPDTALSREPILPTRLAAVNSMG